MNSREPRYTPSYHSDRVLFDNIRIALKDLEALEVRFHGTPRWYPYKAAADMLYDLGLKLREQLNADDRNPYWKLHGGGL